MRNYDFRGCVLVPAICDGVSGMRLLIRAKLRDELCRQDDRQGTTDLRGRVARDQRIHAGLNRAGNLEVVLEVRRSSPELLHAVFVDPSSNCLIVWRRFIRLHQGQEFRSRYAPLSLKRAIGLLHRCQGPSLVGDHDFFAMFGRGRLARVTEIYADKLRPSLSDWARSYWDRRIELFEQGNRRPFYYRGTSGTFALAVNFYLNHVVRLRPWMNDVLATRTIEEQQEIYNLHLRDRFWSPAVRFAMRRDVVLSLLGVPPAQRNQIEMQYEGGIAQFVHDCVEAVFVRLPLADNYFWRVYMTGRYAPDCCPEYLKAENFRKLKDGLADRISVHTDTVQGYLEKHDEPISRFVLLDHMDWLSGAHFAWLEQEWQWIVRRAASGTRVIWRSAGLRTEFVDEARIIVDGRPRYVGELLSYDRYLAAQLHPQCRVHTYGSFHIADLAA